MLTKDTGEGPFIETIELSLRFLGIKVNFVSIALPEPLDLLFYRHEYILSAYKPRCVKLDLGG